MGRRWVTVLAAVFSMLAPLTALANGRFPASNAIMFDPHDAKTIYVRATFGLLVTHDSGDSWRWICERALGFSGTEDPTYVVTPNGTLVGGTFSGLAVSRDRGCTFSFAGGPRTHVLSDLAMRQNGDIVGISSVYAKAGPNGSLYDDHLVMSNDDARTFSVSGGPIDPTLLIQSVEIAESDAARLYLSAVRGDGGTWTAAFLASYNAGLSWEERKLDLAPGETSGFIAIVDPKNADRVYVRTAGTVDARTRLLLTDDAGKTWRRIHESPSPLIGFALAADGSRVFAGSREGIVSSPTDNFAFTKGSSSEIQCLGYSGNALWACSTERSGFFVGISRGGGRGFDAKLHLDEIKGLADCPPESSVVKECTAEWPKLRRQLGLPDEDERPRNVDPGGPALRGRGTHIVRARSAFAAVAGIVGVVLAAYFVLQRLKRGR